MKSVTSSHAASASINLHVNPEYIYKHILITSCYSIIFNDIIFSAIVCKVSCSYIASTKQVSTIVRVTSRNKIIYFICRWVGYRSHNSASSMRAVFTRSCTACTKNYIRRVFISKQRISISVT